MLFGIAFVAMVWVALQDGKIDSSEIGNVVSALVVLSAFVALIASNENLSRQLRIEQQPLVVVTGAIIVEELLSSDPPTLQIKNIGRGPALGVKFSFAEDAITPVFEVGQPNTVDLGATEAKLDWRIQRDLLKTQLANNQNNFFLYTIYTDQLGNHYRGRTRFGFEGGVLKVLQNENTTELG
ncbi:hypothetical protein KC640_00490 [Candidatus Dojkabacteria bacterium]|uniref:Uncharacterized protein n=1 Tax=Candidatus Dojkabacteria bacterium TaxID=2099670 RepID=A0A955I6T1_9BACT|nr:hypothetical protein [Candidatus Dojkabacteria bacterium]